MEKIVENIRTYNIHALLVIGGFEVRPPPGTKFGEGTRERLPLPFQNHMCREVTTGQWTDRSIWLWRVFTFF